MHRVGPQTDHCQIEDALSTFAGAQRAQPVSRASAVSAKDGTSECASQSEQKVQKVTTQRTTKRGPRPPDGRRVPDGVRQISPQERSQLSRQRLENQTV